MAGTEGDSAESVDAGLPILIRPEAETEIREAYQYYEDKTEGLGAEFVRAVEACLASIARYPGMYATVYKQVRRTHREHRRRR